MAVGDIILRALASDPRLGLIAAARREHLAEMAGDPIEVLRAACEQIKRSTGDRRPRSIAMHQAVYERYREWYIESIARAERLLGIGSEAQGAFPTGWPWSKRAGRMSREEKQLRDYLPGWRRALADMPPSRPFRASNGGVLLLASADDIGDGVAVLLAGDRRGGKNGLINEAREELGKVGAQAMAVLHRHPDGQEMTRMSQIIALTNPAGHVVPSMGIDAWMRTSNRRPTGKRAQRARSKPWNQ